MQKILAIKENVMDFNHDAKAHNPLCGDKVHIYAKLDKNKNIWFKF